MGKYKKPDLLTALKRIDDASASEFGDVDIVIDIPSLKTKKDRITMNLDHNLLMHIKGIAAANDVKYQSLINKSLRGIFLGADRSRLSSLEKKVDEIYEILKKTS